MTRWFVEVSPLDAEALTERTCVEADQWQQALQMARKLRGERGPLSRFAIEVNDTGYRAIDPAARLRYVVTTAPDDAELSYGTDAPPSLRAPEPPAQTVPAPALTGTRLLYETAEEPTESVPITYREYGFAVAPWTTAEELRSILDALFAQVLDTLSERTQGKYVQLALFDHVFEQKPERLPIATLGWKDWRGDPVIRIQPPQPDVQSDPPPPRTTPQPPPPVTVADSVESAFDALQEEAVAPASVTLPSPAPLASEGSVTALPRTSQRPRAPDFVIPKAPRAPAALGDPAPPVGEEATTDAPTSLEFAPTSLEAAPTSKSPAVPEESTPPPPAVPSVIPPSHEQRIRRAPDADLIGELFERMAELEYCPDLVSGVEVVLLTLWELLPCEGTLVHVYDIDHGVFVVVRAAGPAPADVTLHRTVEDDPVLEEAMRTGRVVRSDDAEQDPRFQSERWTKLGVRPARALSAGMQQAGRFLGAIELANPITDAPFYETEENGLLYACQHLADFIANRPIVLDDDVVNPEA